MLVSPVLQPLATGGPTFALEMKRCSGNDPGREAGVGPESRGLPTSAGWGGGSGPFGCGVQARARPWPGEECPPVVAVLAPCALVSGESPSLGAPGAQGVGLKGSWRICRAGVCATPGARVPEDKRGRVSVHQLPFLGADTGPAGLTGLSASP